MDTLDERVAHLEGRAMEQTVILAGLSREVAELRQDMHVRFAAVEHRFAAIDQRLTTLDQKMSTHFLWLVGILVSGGLALFAALLTAILRHWLP